LPELGEMESMAWSWLLSLRRVGDYPRESRQVMVWACPGRLGALGGAPLVKVSIDCGLPRRVIGSGNSLAVAVANAAKSASRAGAAVPDLPWQMGLL
jgi:hypothetical protein